MKKDKKIIDKIKYDYEILNLLDKAGIEAYTYVYPCEALDKVVKALLNVVDGQPEVIERDKFIKIVRVRAQGQEPIFKIFNQFRNRKVLATVRKHLLKYLGDNEITLYLHKQSAFAGVCSLCDVGESPLGEIVVKIRVDNPRDVIYWLTRF